MSDPLEPSRTSEASHRIPNFGWASILIVDDDEQNRQLLARATARFGSQIRQAADGVAALEAMATWHVDLVLLDISMPGLSGYDVLERMQADPALRDITVVMVSAADDMDSVVRAIQLGAEDYLPKPCPQEVLRARISGALERVRMRAREAAANVTDGASPRQSVEASAGTQKASSPTEEIERLQLLRDTTGTTVRLANLIIAQLPDSSPLRGYLGEISRANREASGVVQQLLSEVAPEPSEGG